MNGADDAVVPGKSHRIPNPVWRGPRFQNPWDGFRIPGFRELWKVLFDPGDNPPPHGRTTASANRMFSDTAGGWLLDNPGATPADIRERFAAREVDGSAIASPPAEGVRCMWVGHSTLLVQMDGVTFLTDPIFSDRASPLQFVGPKRLAPLPITLEDPRLPEVDFVIVSHSHYDHLDKPSVMRILRRWGSRVRWYVPLGLAEWFRKRGARGVTELDWWEGVRHPGSGVDITLTPAQHWSKRKLIGDINRSLWGSFAVTGRSRFFFAGDTGYCPAFREIGERLGPFDLAAIPIGAYDPRWFMAPQHVDPFEAVQIHLDVRARRSVPIHWGTFALTFEALDEPPIKLKDACSKAGVPCEDFSPLAHGEVITVGPSMPAPKSTAARLLDCLRSCE